MMASAVPLTQLATAGPRRWPCCPEDDDVGIGRLRQLDDPAHRDAPGSAGQRFDVSGIGSPVAATQPPTAVAAVRLNRHTDHLAGATDTESPLRPAIIRRCTAAPRRWAAGDATSCSSPGASGVAAELVDDEPGDECLILRVRNGYGPRTGARAPPRSMSPTTRRTQARRPSHPCSPDPFARRLISAGDPALAQHDVILGPQTRPVPRRPGSRSRWVM